MQSTAAHVHDHEVEMQSGVERRRRLTSGVTRVNLWCHKGVTRVNLVLQGLKCGVIRVNCGMMQYQIVAIS